MLQKDNVGDLLCERCPPNSRTDSSGGATAIFNCACEEDFYDGVEGDEVECALCPVGFDCGCALRLGVVKEGDDCQCEFVMADVVVN